MARDALAEYANWIRDQLLPRANDDFALGSAAYGELIALRAFEGLDAEEILEIGEEQLAAHREARRQVAAEIDAGVSEAEVVDRVKSDHPADFEAALAGYRRSMAEAPASTSSTTTSRRFPPGESLKVIADATTTCAR